MTSEEERQKIMKEEDENRKTCQNCGYYEKWHKEKPQGYFTGLEGRNIKPCKKFVPKTSLGKKPKGCGRKVQVWNLQSGRQLKCGKYIVPECKKLALCPECSKKNHSPQSADGDTPSIENTNEVIVEGTQNHAHQKALTKASGELIHTAPCGEECKSAGKSLSEKKVFVSGAYVNKKHRGYVYPEKHVKKFIKLLKEDFRKEINKIPPEFNKEKMLNQVDIIMWSLIDKLAGKNLSGNL